MADNVRFLSGGIGNLDKQPITPGNIYFALSDDKTYGYIVYDFKDSDNSNSRIVMSAKAKTAGQVEFPLVIGEHSYDGSERIEIPIYDGSSESGSECFDISILDNMLVLDNDKIWLFKDGKIDKTAPVDFGLAANESIKALSDRLNNIESDYLTTTDKDQVVTMISNEALERKSQIGDIGDKTVKKYVDDKTYEVDTKIDKLNNSISSEVTARQAADDVLTARINTFTSLAEGSTTSDAELADIRVKADGTTADTAGNAVREQISELKSDLGELSEVVGTDSSDRKILDELCGMVFDGSNIIANTSTHNGIYFKIPKGKTATFICNIGFTSCIVLDQKPYVGMAVNRIDVTSPYAAENADKYIFGTVMTTTEYAPSVTVSFNDSGIIKKVKDNENDIKNAIDELNKLRLYGKKIVNFGDSIFGNAQGDTSISAKIATKTGSTVYNIGFGGTRMTDSREVKDGWSCFDAPNIVNAIAEKDFSSQDTALNSGLPGGTPWYFSSTLNTLKGINFNDVDIVTFNHGSNDYTSGIIFDNQSDKEDVSTYKGAIRRIVKVLLYHYPHLKIVFISPAWRFWMNSDGSYLRDSTEYYISDIGEAHNVPDFVNAMDEASNEMNCPMINVYRVGINRWNRSLNFPSDDGAHHNEHGREILADHIARQLMSI